MELAKVIAAEWKKNALLFSIILIHVACEVECFFFFEDNCSTADHLFSTEEDADTHFLLRAHDACLNWQDIIIHTILKYG